MANKVPAIESMNSEIPRAKAHGNRKGTSIFTLRQSRWQDKTSACVLCRPSAAVKS